MVRPLFRLDALPSVRVFRLRCAIERIVVRLSSELRGGVLYATASGTFSESPGRITLAFGNQPYRNKGTATQTAMKNTGDLP